MRQSSAKAAIVMIKSHLLPVDAKFMAVAMVPGPARIGMAKGVIATLRAASRLNCRSLALG